MNLKFYKPVTPTMRHKVSVSKSDLWKGDPIKFLCSPLEKRGGRNNTGKITSYHIGGGNKVKYRKIDKYRDIFNIEAIIVRTEYDPNRSCFISLIGYSNGILSYITHTNGLKPGDIIASGTSLEQRDGYRMMIKSILPGSPIHDIELDPSSGSKISRSAGCSSTLLSKGKDGYALVKLSSGELRKINLSSLATLGVSSNINNRNTVLGKAGASRWMGRRPIVRGVAMNPVDHPHGGGEGKTSGGRCSVTPWGIITKGFKTNKKNLSKYIIKRRN
uniref:Ribosomal protein L2 n=1 Tax=Imasa heleensis TaxID=2772037 RepID=A0A893DDE9_9EUKA|nr:ribosomal protein L2 [Imasa heleensis]QRR29760.1 ribosomal protein L2 [Imasa heleensis]